MSQAESKAKNSNWLEIRKTLSRCSERDLLGLVAELYSLSKSNKDFLDARFLRDNQALLRYKAQVKRYLAPDEPWKESQKISLKEAKKAISDYKKASGDEWGTLELMVYYAECGTDFLCEFGDMYEQYYNSLESVFDNALKLMKKSSLNEIQEFVNRLEKVVWKARHMGWGYYDNISAMLQRAWPDRTKL